MWGLGRRAQSRSRFAAEGLRAPNGPREPQDPGAASTRLPGAHRRTSHPKADPPTCSRPTDARVRHPRSQLFLPTPRRDAKETPRSGAAACCAQDRNPYRETRRAKQMEGNRPVRPAVARRHGPATPKARALTSARLPALLADRLTGIGPSPGVLSCLPTSCRGSLLDRLGVPRKEAECGLDLGLAELVHQPMELLAGSHMLTLRRGRQGLGELVRFDVLCRPADRELAVALEQPAHVDQGHGDHPP